MVVVVLRDKCPINVGNCLIEAIVLRVDVLRGFLSIGVLVNGVVVNGVVVLGGNCPSEVLSPG